MSTTLKLVVLVIATILSLIWIILCLKYESTFEQITATLDPDEYQLAPVMHVGFAILQLVHFNVKSEQNRESVKEMAEVYGARYAEYYLYVLRGAQVTFFATLFPMALMLGVIMNSLMNLFLFVILAVASALYLSEQFKNKLTQRRDALVNEFPQVLTKMTLLVNSGMMLRDAWKKICENKEGVLYDEMRLTTDELNNGVTEINCYFNFAERCGLKQMRKFASLVTQSLAKGGSDLSVFLRDMSDEMWAEKQADVRVRAEKAGARLMIPTVMLVIVPALAGM